MLDIFNGSARSSVRSEDGPPNLPIKQLSVEWMEWLVSEDALDSKWRTRRHMHLDFSDDLFNLTTFFPKDFKYVLKRPKEPKYEIEDDEEYEDEAPLRVINSDMVVSKLISLDLSDNQLKDDIFDPRHQDTKSLTGVLFTNIKILNLQNNLLRYPVIVLPCLKELYLSKNELLRIPPTGGVPDLEVFMLDGNKIKTIDIDTIKDLRNLQELDLSENLIEMKPSALSKMFTTLSPKLFQDLRKLDLRQNQFCNYFTEYQMLAAKILTQLEKLDDISFEDNPGARQEMERQATKYFEFSAPKPTVSASGKEETADPEPDPVRLAAIDKGVKDRMNLAAGEQITLHMQEGKKEFRKPTYSSLVELLDTALSDPPKAEACINLVFQEVCQIADNMAKGNQRGDTMKSKKGSEQELAAFVQQSLVLIERVPSCRLILLKSISKFSIVQDGVALAAVAQLATGNGAPMEEIIEVLEDNVIPELSKKREPTFTTLVLGLSKFDYNSEELAELFAKTENLVETFCERLEPMLHDGQSIDETDKEGPLQLALSSLLRCAVQHKKNADIATNRKRICYELVMRLVPLQMDSKEITGDDTYSTALYLHWSAILCRCIALFPEKATRDLLTRDKNFMQRLVDLASNPIDTRLTAGDSTEKLTCLVCKKIGAVLRVITAMLPKREIMQMAFAEEPEPGRKTLLDLVLRAPSDSSADPLILGPSLACLRVALLDPGIKALILKTVIDKMDLLRTGSNKMFLYYIDSKKFKDLYKRCEMHLQAKSQTGNKPGVTTTAIPDFSGVTNVYVHDTVVEIVNFVGLFSQLERENDYEELCARVSDTMNTLGRDTLIMKLLEIPSDSVRRAVIECLRYVKTEQLDSGEFDQLLEMFDPEAVEREEILIGEVMSLFQRLVDDASGAGDMFRARYAANVLQKATDCLSKNASRNTYGNKAEEAQKARLSLSAVSLLWTSSRHALLRKHLRSHDLSLMFRKIMKDEEIFHSHGTQDICIELTWIGRSIENLLGCLSGQDRLEPQKKQGFRVIHRIADIMEGKSDVFLTSPSLSAEDRAWQEAEMWNDVDMKTRLTYIDDMEFEDRTTQQQCFVSFQALGRMISFLEKHPDIPKNKRGNLEAEGQRQSSQLDHDMVHWAHEALEQADVQDVSRHETGIGKTGKHASRHVLEILRKDRESKQQEEVQEVDMGDREHEPIDHWKIRHALEEHGWNGDEQLVAKRLLPMHLGLPAMLEKEEIYMSDQTDNLNKSMVFPFAFSNPLWMEKDRMVDMRRELEENTWKEFEPQEKEANIGVLPEELERLWAFSKHLEGVRYVIFFINLYPEELNAAEFKADELFHRVYMTGGWKLDEDLAFDMTDFAIPRIPRRMRSQGASFFKAGTDGYVPLVYALSATLRAVYGVLSLPAVERVRLDLISRLRFVSYQSRLTGLIEQCGSDVHCNISAKYLRICSMALRSSPDRTIIKPDPEVPALEEDHDYVVCMSMSAHFAARCLKLLTPLLSHFGRGYVLTSEQQRLCVEALRLLESLCEVVPYVQLSDVREVQVNCSEHLLEHLMPMSTIRSVVVCLIYEMQVNVGSWHGPYINGKYVKSSMERRGLREICSNILVAVIQLAPSMKYEVIEMFYKYEVLGRNEVRVSFLTELLNHVELTKCCFTMETMIQDMGNTYERILRCVHVEIPLKRPGGFGLGFFTASHLPRMLVITNRRILIFDYPKHGVLTRKCGHCPPDSFCPVGPSIAEERTFAEITRIVRGADPQMFAIGWLKATFSGLTKVLTEQFEVFICYRTDVRTPLLETITTLSGPTIETRTDPELDVLVRQAILTRVERDGGSQIVCTSWAKNEDYAQYFVLFILTSTHVCQADIHFEKWLPPITDGPAEAHVDDDDGFLQKQSDQFDISMFAGPGVKANKSRLKRVQRSFAQEWLAGEKDKPKKHLHAFWSTMSDADLDKVMEDRTEARTKFNSNVKERGKQEGQVEPNAKQAKNAAQTAMRKARQAIFKDWRQWEIADLERISFDPGKEPTVSLTFGGKKSSAETITIHFQDDAARERWRHGIAQILNRADNVVQWSRKWDTSVGETTV